MKKFLVIMVVLAVACLSSAAFAADVTVSGEVSFRSRLFENLDFNRSRNTDSASRTIMESRYLVSVNVKGENNVKGKLTLWNDFDEIGRVSSSRTNNNKGTSGNTSTVFIREAWIDFMVPDTNLGFTGGERLLMIGNGWFYRSMYGPTGAYTVYYKAGDSMIAVQDIKMAERADGGGTNTFANDVDIYTAFGTTKLAGMTLGLDLSMIRDNSGVLLAAANKGRLYNLGLNLNGKVGSATIKAEVDLQSGMADRTSGDSVRYSGKQVVLQASVPMDAVTINATAAYGSGNKSGSTSQAGILTVNDIARHYTLIYEYRVAGASGRANSGFENTTALGLGASAKVSKTIEVGADVWYLRASEQVALGTAIGAGSSSPDKSYELGTEIDARVNWKITKDLTWTWDMGYFLPGAAYNTATTKADPGYAVQGALTLKF